DRLRLLRLAQERRARAVPAARDLRHRAAEVQIEKIEAHLLDHRRGLAHRAGIAADELRAERPVLGDRLEQLERLAVALDERVRGDHLEEGELHTLLSRDQAESKVRAGRHGTLDQPAGNAEGLELDGVVRVCGRSWREAPYRTARLRTRRPGSPRGS